MQRLIFFDFFSQTTCGTHAKSHPQEILEWKAKAKTSTVPSGSWRDIFIDKFKL